MCVHPARNTSVIIPYFCKKVNRGETNAMKCERCLKEVPEKRIRKCRSPVSSKINLYCLHCYSVFNKGFSECYEELLHK